MKFEKNVHKWTMLHVTIINFSNHTKKLINTKILNDSKNAIIVKRTVYELAVLTSWLYKNQLNFITLLLEVAGASRMCARSLNIFFNCHPLLLLLDVHYAIHRAILKL